MIARLPRGTVAAVAAAVLLWGVLSLIEPGPVPSPFRRGGSSGEMPTWLLGAISITLMVAVITSVLGLPATRSTAGKRDVSASTERTSTENTTAEHARANSARVPAPGWYWPMLIGAQLICLVFALPTVLAASSGA